jgi:hypothetical protein
MNKLIVALLVGLFAFGPASGWGEDAATSAGNQTPGRLPSSNKEKEQAIREALKDSSKPQPLPMKPLMGDFPQRRDRVPRTQPKASTDTERAERKQLVDEWEKTQRPAPK